MRDNRLAVWGGVAAAALWGAALIPSGPPGIGLLLAAAAIAGAVGYAGPRPLDLESGAFAGAALLLLSMATLLDARWVVAVDVAAAACCSALAITGARSWGAVFAAPLRVAATAVRVPVELARSIPRGWTSPWAGPARRAVSVSLLLVGIFGALFSSADAAFAQIAEDVLFPDVGLDLLPARIFVALLIVAGTGALILVAREPVEEPAEAGERRRITTLEWALPLLVLDALFAAFVLVQLTVLFGGHDHVLETTGLTYAQYARAGFFQLVVIAGLVLAVIAVAVKLAGTEREGLLKGLLGVLCLLTMVVLASALRRMDLYEQAYGLTRIRISVHAVDLWLAGVFALVIAAGLTGRGAWLPRAVAGFTVMSLLWFNLSNPDARIARSAIERWERTGDVDGHYASTLSADALPALAELPGDAGACIVRPIVVRTQEAPDPWSSFNLSRHRARALTTVEEPAC